MLLEAVFYSAISEVCIESEAFEWSQSQTTVEAYIFALLLHGRSSRLFCNGITERLAFECTVRHHRLPTIQVVHLVIKVAVVVEWLVIVRTSQHGACTYRDVLVQFRVDREVAVVTCVLIRVDLHHTFLIQVAQCHIVVGLTVTTVDSQAVVLLWRPVLDVLVVPVPCTDKEHTTITEFEVTTQFHFWTELVTVAVLFPVFLHLLDVLSIYTHVTYYVVRCNRRRIGCSILFTLKVDFCLLPTWKLFRILSRSTP